MKKCIILFALIFPVLMLAQDRGNLPFPNSGSVNLSLDEYNKLVDAIIPLLTNEYNNTNNNWNSKYNKYFCCSSLFWKFHLELLLHSI